MRDNMKLMLFLAILFSSVGQASDVVFIDYLTEMDDETYLSSNPRIYRAEGQHQCQSKDSLGHTCTVIGVNFTDCNVAFFNLKKEDCCKGSRYGGNSIGFKVTKCTNFN
jgi:hypothetical protein